MSGAGHVKLRFCWPKQIRKHVGSSVVRTRSEVRGPCSELGEVCGAVPLSVELLLYHAALLEHAPLASYRSRGKEEREDMVRR